MLTGDRDQLFQEGSGFGLPPLDAFSCNCPVIAANVTSIPEVVGDAALLVDPRNEQQIADTLLRLLDGGGLTTQMVARGQARANEFSWEKTAEVTASIIKEVLGLPPSHR